MIKPDDKCLKIHLNPSLKKNSTGKLQRVAINLKKIILASLDPCPGTQI